MTTDDTYKTVSAPGEGIYKEKGSKFLAFAVHVESEEDVKAFLAAKRKEFYDARHHCYAYILGEQGLVFRANDDGEPSGTGGRPIHGQLLSVGVTNTLVLVVRYFGGVLLGASGLANAYKAAARDALEAATIEERTIDDHYRVRFEWPQMNDVMRILKDNGLAPKDQLYDERCEIVFSVRKSMSERVKKAFENLRTVEIEMK